MAAERVIYVVVDCDEVPVRAFTDRGAADALVAEQPELHVVAVPLAPEDGPDGS